MNTITGTTNAFWRASYGLVLLVIAMTACTSATSEQKAETEIKSDVKVTQPVIATIEQTSTFKGTTRYLQTNTFRAQVSGILKSVGCQVAGTVSDGQPLFIVQPMEAAALQKSGFNDEDFNAFQDTTFSNLNGTVSSLNVQVGDFVQAGDVLATCIRTNSMRIVIDVPAEQLGKVRTGTNCTILLPDGETAAGKVIGQWPSATVQNQTQPFIIKPTNAFSLAENISLSVQFETGKLPDALWIPKSALQGNELQTEFWVMKLVNDTTCIKIPVTKGQETDSLVQLLDSPITNADRLVSEGGYGLPDTAIVRIIKN
ncbi:efflux RND transporter periplasmic adaptor subunit [Mangrovibacterium diazotrophicum]|uniref:HlyD family secretion protein n=1 Tax=Mangrovibacterium diazotrophicum TaxID=1261403 RepID=A0A419W3J5_9BACT|nr:HlyD family efflux transporter periplasmic adaptor subunit [Mangrovibacterium diazotrophicum]RKD90009.1 HlyD family secretion protein [Mangrovibacterium diazotrophicum]